MRMKLISPEGTWSVSEDWTAPQDDAFGTVPARLRGVTISGTAEGDSDRIEIMPGVTVAFAVLRTFGRTRAWVANDAPIRGDGTRVDYEEVRRYIREQEGSS
jgi:hypothetical protein